MRRNPNRQWNRSVAQTVKKLEPVKKWLRTWMKDSDTDWESQKSAHQALKFLEMAEYEMWNMQYWTTPKQRRLYNQAEDTVF